MTTEQWFSNSHEATIPNLSWASEFFIDLSCDSVHHTPRSKNYCHIATNKTIEAFKQGNSLLRYIADERGIGCTIYIGLYCTAQDSAVYKRWAICIRQVLEIKGETVSLKMERCIQAAAYT